MFIWQPDTIRFMRDASEYGDYHRKLAAKITSFLPQNAQVCDAGCGLGYLSLALAETARNVTAIDISPEAIAVLRSNIQKNGVRNIQAVTADIRTYLPEEPFDAMIFCFFGNIAEALALAKRRCDGVVILIKRNYLHHRYSVGKHPLERYSFAQSCEELESSGIPARREEFTLENGQPFRSLQDAVTFFQIYSRDAAPERITEGWVRAKLVDDPSGLYPYYLPTVKEIGLLALEARDIPESFSRMDCV